MNVTLIGMGLGTPATMTAEGMAALQQADLLLGAARLLEGLDPQDLRPRIAATKPQALLDGLRQAQAERPCVLYSGDSGFYSGTRSLLPLLAAEGISYRVLPGISSVQYLSAKLGQPWQDWTLVSAHGVDCDAVSAVCGGRPVFFLTGGTWGPAALCRQLADAGLGDSQVTAGENLSYENECIRTGTAQALSEQSFAPLSVLLVQPALRPKRVPGLPDDAFLRGTTPMTKQEVRAAVLAKLGIGPTDICWDIGAGTGSVSVELALQSRAVWAVEYKPEACALIRENRTKFGAWNLRLVEGKAPAALEQLPVPDAVFIGGSEGELPAIIAAIHQRNPNCRICISAITLETLHTAVTLLTQYRVEVDICQIHVTKARTAGSSHLMMAQNPVTLITASGAAVPFPPQSSL